MSYSWLIPLIMSAAGSFMDKGNQGGGYEYPPELLQLLQGERGYLNELTGRESNLWEMVQRALYELEGLKKQVAEGNITPEMESLLQDIRESKIGTALRQGDEMLKYGLGDIVAGMSKRGMLSSTPFATMSSRLGEVASGNLKDIIDSATRQYAEQRITLPFKVASQQAAMSNIPFQNWMGLSNIRSQTAGGLGNLFATAQRQPRQLSPFQSFMGQWGQTGYKGSEDIFNWIKNLFSSSGYGQTNPTVSSIR